MEITTRGLFAVLHGILLGGFFLLALYALFWETLKLREPLRFERAYLVGVVAVGWVAVLTGAYVIYPWYRAVAPSGSGDLALYPRALLLSSDRTARWHSLGMEWKEHVAWIAAIGVTAVAYVLAKHRTPLTRNPGLKRLVVAFALVSFVSASVAGVFGAMLNKAAPIQGGPVLSWPGAGR